MSRKKYDWRKERDEWSQKHPRLNPNYMTRFGPAWRITPEQEAILDSEEDGMVHQNEIRSELTARLS
jgi:hypothetical protein